MYRPVSKPVAREICPASAPPPSRRSIRKGSRGRTTPKPIDTVKADAINTAIAAEERFD
jgi:hypothetical protein